MCALALEFNVLGVVQLAQLVNPAENLQVKNTQFGFKAFLGCVTCPSKMTHLAFNSLTSLMLTSEAAEAAAVAHGMGVDAAVLALLTDSLCRSNCRIEFDSFS